MKRYLGFALAMFVAVVAIALVGGDSGAFAGCGCHGGLLAKHRAKKCHGEEASSCHGGLLAKHRAKKAERRCHGAEACCESCDSCDSCGCVSEGCSSCGGCAGGNCGGEGVISEGAPTEAAPAAPAST